MEKRFFMVAELADFLNIKRSSAYNLVHAKGFPSLKLGHNWRIDCNKLERWLKIAEEEKDFV